MQSDQEKKPDKRVGAAGYRIPEERKVAARILYETIPGLSQQQVAEQVGVSRRTVEEWVKADSWKKAAHNVSTEMSQTAQEVADKFATKIEEFGTEVVTPEQKAEVVKQVTEDTAISMRAQILDRHRREWGAIRAILYDTLQKKEYGDRAKLAKISAETLQIIQSNERKAWGLDPTKPDQPSVVVIERD